MTNLDYKADYRKNLPHIQPAGAILFVTCRLAGSLPQAVLARLKEEAEREEQNLRASAPAEELDRLLYRAQRQAFGRFDTVLDEAQSGPMWLKRPEVAAIVAESMHYLNGKQYDLDVFCIMGNHFHVVFAPLQGKDGQYVALQRIMHSLKRHTARKANDVLGREGAFWQHESYDHIVRDEAELQRIRQYVLNNPVKARLVDDAEKWPHSWANWW